MPVTVKIKRGTESQISSGSLSLGEVALATDTKSIFIGDGVGKTLVGKCIIDTFANRPAYGKNGRFFYASDTGVLYLDNGSAWVTAGGAHTHTSANISDATSTPTASKIPISDGSGKLDGWISDSASGTKGLIQLTGHLGGTAASPTVTNVDNDIITLDKMAHGTQGEILYYGESGVPYRLSPGISGQYLKTQGAGANPVWAAVSSSMPSKAIQQVVYASRSTVFSTTSTSPTAVPSLSVAITPTSSSSKILIIFSGGLYTTMTGGVAPGVTYIYRGASSIHTLVSVLAPGTTLLNGTYAFIDSPATTSSTTYAIYAKGGSDGYVTTTMYVGGHYNGSANTFLIVAEILP